MITIVPETEVTRTHVTYTYYNNVGAYEAHRTIVIVNGRISIPVTEDLNTGQLDEFIDALQLAKKLANQTLEVK